MRKHVQTKNNRESKADSHPAINKHIGTPLRDLSQRVYALTTEMQAQDQRREASQHQQESESVKRHKIDFRASVVFSLLSIVLSGLTLYVLKQQTQIMDQQRQIIDDTLKATKDTADAAKSSVEIARKTLLTTDKNAHLDQRAWLSIRVGDRSEYVAEGKPLKSLIRIKNVGKTPAKRAEMHLVVEKVPADQPPSLVYVDGDPSHHLIYTGMIIPNMPDDIEISQLSKQKPSPLDPPVLTDADMEELKAGKAYVATFGRVTYIDIYGVEHWVQFCIVHTLVNGIYNYKKCTDYDDMDNN